uniref:histidine kinase n=1 Tax=Nonomuraea gerenzanensis TaxID=93944 RepID=A0A1M4EDC4_9ACTN|nr:putative two component sensor kinase [Nonomuraea gerenzanensis]
MFLVSGAALLALTNLLVGANDTEVVPVQATVVQQPGLAAAQQRIHSLETQLSQAEATQSRRLLTGSLVALAVMAAVSVLMGNVIADRVLRPLRTITTATRRISADNLHERLAVPGPADEVKDLADTIDGLLERLEASFTAQRRFVANASHELRTPLSIMRASVDVALAKPEPVPPQTVALADRLHTQLDRVDHLLEGLLVLARAQHGPLADASALSLGDLVSRALTARAADLTARNLTLHDGELQPAARTQGSRTLLSRMVDNVIDNAIVHNQDGGWIRVTTSGDDATVRLIVETGGPVLDPAHVARLGRPFQRLADRTGPVAGSGLGLSIVTAIVCAHDGRLSLSARPEGGLRVTVSLPSAPAPEGGAG